MATIYLSIYAHLSLGYDDMTAVLVQQCIHLCIRSLTYIDSLITTLSRNQMTAGH
jgi:hypothetical protein